MRRSCTRILASTGWDRAITSSSGWCTPGLAGLITKTDGGRQTINFANIGGDLGGAAVTQLYYPPLNRNFTQVMSTWGSSIGGDAVGYVANEFLPELLTTLHLKKSN